MPQRPWGTVGRDPLSPGKVRFTGTTVRPVSSWEGVRGAGWTCSNVKELCPVELVGKRIRNLFFGLRLHPLNNSKALAVKLKTRKRKGRYL